MKRITILLFLMLLTTFSTTFAQTQMDTILTMLASDYDSAGFAKYPPSYVTPGQVLLVYKAYTSDTVNDLVLVKSFTDDDIGTQHYRYQQTYKGLRVEFAEFVEHAENGYVTRANGKIVGDMDAGTTPLSSESEALYAALLPYEDIVLFAWDDDDSEKELREDMDDDEATYYPEGELLFALDDYSTLPAAIPAERYRLAWRFDVLAISPYFHKAIYVDASDGTVFREESLISHNGPANVYANTPLQTWSTTQTIDTQRDFFVGPWILSSNDNGRNIHTKYFDGSATWNQIPEVKNTDDDWPVSDIMETNVHWNACESWDFFAAAPYNRDGMNGNGSVVRVLTQWDLKGSTQGLFEKRGGFQRMYIGTDYCQGSLDIVGHEFTHGVTLSTAELPNSWEGGALNESMSDIFGTLIERRSNSGSMDWQLGNLPTFANGFSRSLDDPGTDSEHLDDLNSCISTLGQPTCWKGPRFEFGVCDVAEYGAHINSSVQNYAFFYLANGGSGINEMANSYSVTGIGLDDAARIAFRALTSIFTSGTQFPQARSAWIQAAEEIFGVCSPEAQQTANAWNAVNVGPPSNCPVNANDPNFGAQLSAIVSPNPSSAEFIVTFEEYKARDIIVMNAVGKTLQQFKTPNAITAKIDLHLQPPGVYFVRAIDPKHSYSLKLIKR